MRTGKPCSTGSASPFMPKASIASRPSVATFSGTLIVMPSTSVHRIWSESLPTPARSRTSVSLTPSQRAPPT